MKKPVTAPPPPKRGEAKRKHIEAVAIAVFMEKGYDATSMDLIATRAAVSKATLYNHFENKPELFACLIRAMCDQMRANIFNLDGVRGQPEQVLEMLGSKFIEAVLQPGQMAVFRTLTSEAHKFPELGRAFEAAGPEPGAIALGRYLRRLDQEGVLDIPDERLAAGQFIALCDAGLSRRAHFQVERPTSAQIKKRVQSAVRLFLRGYAKKAA